MSQRPVRRSRPSCCKKYKPHPSPPQRRTLRLQFWVRQTPQYRIVPPRTQAHGLKVAWNVPGTVRKRGRLGKRYGLPAHDAHAGYYEAGDCSLICLRASDCFFRKLLTSEAVSRADHGAVVPATEISKVASGPSSEPRTARSTLSYVA